MRGWHRSFVQQHVENFTCQARGCAETVRGGRTFACADRAITHIRIHTYYTRNFTTRLVLLSLSVLEGGYWQIIVAVHLNH